MPLFSSKTKINPLPQYQKITCMNLHCMTQFDHSELLFRLHPPKEVDDYRMRQFTGAQTSGAAAARREGAAKQRDILAGLDDDDDENEDIGDEIEEVEEAPHPVAANVENSRLEEMARYYYGVPNGSGYEYGGGEKPNFIRISSTQSVESTSGAFPRPASRKYFKGNPATNYVTSIVDCYGNETTTSVCPHCHTPAFTKAGLYESYVMPIIGVSQSGKGVLLAESLNPFMRHTARYMLRQGAYLADHDTQVYLNEMSESLRENGEISSTLGVQRLMAELDSVDRKILMCTFDLPGEHIANTKFRTFREEELSNLLHRANGIVIIYCPEQIESITKSNLNPSKDDNTPVEADAREAAKENTISMKQLEDMIRLLANEADAREVVKENNIPIAVVLTKLDLFNLNGGINSRIDISRMEPAAKNMLDSIVTREEKTVLPEYPDVVNIGEIERFGQKTTDFFRELIPNELNLILNKFAGSRYNVNCFAMSAQGFDVESEEQTPPIRPNEPFYWLFARMGIYKQTPPTQQKGKNNGRR